MPGWAAKRRSPSGKPKPTVATVAERLAVLVAQATALEADMAKLDARAGISPATPAPLAVLTGRITQALSETQQRLRTLQMRDLPVPEESGEVFAEASRVLEAAAVAVEEAKIIILAGTGSGKTRRAKVGKKGKRT